MEEWVEESSALFDKSVEIKGLAGYLLAREHRGDQVGAGFALTTAARVYGVGIEDYETWCREHHLKWSPQQGRYRTFAAVDDGTRGSRSIFFPLRKQNHSTLDAAIVATVYAVTRCDEWPVERWKLELVTAQEQFDAASNFGKRPSGEWDADLENLWQWLSHIPAWIDYLKRR